MANCATSGLSVRSRPLKRILAWAAPFAIHCETNMCHILKISRLHLQFAGSWLNVAVPERNRCVINMSRKTRIPCSKASKNRLGEVLTVCTVQTVHMLIIYCLIAHQPVGWQERSFVYSRDGHEIHSLGLFSVHEPSVWLFSTNIL